MTAQETQNRIRDGLKCLHDLRAHWREVLEPVNILVVDDNKDFCHVLTETIDGILDRRCRVIQSFTGKEALRVIATEHIDILFLDLIMPDDGNGIDVLRSLPKETSSMIVLIITGAGEESEEIKQARQLGFSTVIHKTDLWDDLHSIFGIGCSTCKKS